MSENIPLFQIEDDEQFAYEVPGTNAVFTFHRIAYSERQELLQIYQSRGQLDQRGFDLATFGMALLGWTHFRNRQGEIAYPQEENVLERRKCIADAMAKCPIEQAAELLARIRTPSPEELVQRFFASLNESDSSRTPTPATAIPAHSVAPSAPLLGNPSPATAEG